MPAVFTAAFTYSDWSMLQSACLHSAALSAADLKSQMLLMPTLSESVLCTRYIRGTFEPHWWLMCSNAHHVCAAAPAYAEMHGCCVQVWVMLGLHLHHQYRPGCSFCCWLCTSGSLRWEDFLPCHVMSCHVMSCHVMSCHVMSCHVMSCHVIELAAALALTHVPPPWLSPLHRIGLC